MSPLILGLVVSLQYPLWVPSQSGWWTAAFVLWAGEKYTLYSIGTGVFLCSHQLPIFLLRNVPAVTVLVSEWLKLERIKTISCQYHWGGSRPSCPIILAGGNMTGICKWEIQEAATSLEFSSFSAIVSLWSTRCSQGICVDWSSSKKIYREIGICGGPQEHRSSGNACQLKERKEHMKREGVSHHMDKERDGNVRRCL